ncbi:hypothetical protein EVAR_74215_1 [Eumeta japonica]|uniref:Uncharacterized protein n=1 Tax=Eumeta variegata TaxID=151549 RepID=A0A4C1SCA8_EUMVA|nr:hypothetical protein EVAR_74215_1 [Eumeta japonica]
MLRSIIISADETAAGPPAGKGRLRSRRLADTLTRSSVGRWIDFFPRHGERTNRRNLARSRFQPTTFWFLATRTPPGRRRT